MEKEVILQAVSKKHTTKTKKHTEYNIFTNNSLVGSRILLAIRTNTPLKISV